MNNLRTFEEFDFGKKGKRPEYKAGDGKYYKKIKGEWVDITKKEWLEGMGIKDTYGEEKKKN